MHLARQASVLLELGPQAWVLVQRGLVPSALQQLALAQSVPWVSESMASARCGLPVLPASEWTAWVRSVRLV